MKASEPDVSLDADDEGFLYLVTRQALGHVASVDPEKIPPSVWDEYISELDLYNDGQRAARGYDAARSAAWSDRFGDFGKRFFG